MWSLERHLESQVLISLVSKSLRNSWLHSPNQGDLLGGRSTCVGVWRFNSGVKASNLSINSQKEI